MVFYNGLKKEENRIELRLSDAFEGKREDVESSLECRAILLNINSGYNEELM
ncbi:MAG: hypothetical protein HFJ10_06450 [Lachnospiraceae bacterium]|nr:hypothetical protein [Lachnospiraceae bacterium]